MNIELGGYKILGKCEMSLRISYVLCPSKSNSTLIPFPQFSVSPEVSSGSFEKVSSLL